MTILALTFSLSPFPLCPSPCTDSLIALFLLPLEPRTGKCTSDYSWLKWSSSANCVQCNIVMFTCQFRSLTQKGSCLRKKNPTTVLPPPPTPSEKNFRDLFFPLAPCGKPDMGGQHRAPGGERALSDHGLSGDYWGVDQVYIGAPHRCKRESNGGRGFRGGGIVTNWSSSCIFLAFAS